MASPGEVPQAIGRAYSLALIGSLELSVKGFRRVFDVETSPEKLSFQLPSGSVSFDAAGIIERSGWPTREVLIECKGHRDGSSVLEGYRKFLGTAFFVFTTIERHVNDWFWFVSNVPFGSSFGRRLTEYSMVRSILNDHSDAKQIITSRNDAEQLVYGFLNRLAICIFPDSFMRVTGVRYSVRDGDNLWTILQAIHGGTVPYDDYQLVANRIARENNLVSADLIVPRTDLILPWHGIEWDDPEDSA